MRTIKLSKRFRKDFQKVRAAPNGVKFLEPFEDVVDRLARDEPLAERFRDHSLTGKWIDHRDCHIRPDLVLIYQKPDEATLNLVRIGSHSDLGL